MAAASGVGRNPLVPDSLLRTIAGELSVENALKQTAAIASRARYPNSQGFFDAAEYVARRAREYGLGHVRVERFPAPEPMWDAAEASLDVIAPVPEPISALERVPELLAHNSADGDVTAELVDVGRGVSEADYRDKDVRGKVLLATGEPQPVWRAMGPRGARALIAAPSGDFFGRHTPPDAVLWGEAPAHAVVLMVSPRQAGRLRALMRRAPVIVRLHAKASRSEPGALGMVMGEIAGTHLGEDLVIAAHLDHQKPGANDNASGSGTLLELVRTLNHLIVAGKIPKPQRTLRFWWTTEIVSEQAYFRRYPEDARNILLSVVLDQAGGLRNAENNLVIIFNPAWLPSYADDLIENLAESVKDRYAPAEYEPDPLVIARGGSHQSLRTVYWDYQEITDEVAFESRERRIPGIALAVPSLDLIHSNLDTVDRLDPTWMKRTALLTLAAALYVADAGPAQAQAVLDYTFRRAAGRLAQSDDAAGDLAFERARLDSVRALDPKLDTTAYQNQLSAVADAVRNRRR